MYSFNIRYKTCIHSREVIVSATFKLFPQAQSLSVGRLEIAQPSWCKHISSIIYAPELTIEKLHSVIRLL